MISIRSAVAADAEALVAMMAAFYAHFDETIDRQRTHDAVTALLNSPGLGQVWLFADGTAHAGYTVATLAYSLERGGQVVLLDELYVAPAYRGQGLGQRALERVEQYCQEVNARAVLLEVEHTNSGAQRLYTRCGFTLLARHVMEKSVERPLL